MTEWKTFQLMKCTTKWRNVNWQRRCSTSFKNNYSSLELFKISNWRWLCTSHYITYNYVYFKTFLEHLQTLTSVFVFFVSTKAEETYYTFFYTSLIFFWGSFYFICFPFFSCNCWLEIFSLVFYNFSFSVTRSMLLVFVYDVELWLISLNISVLSRVRKRVNGEV